MTLTFLLSMYIIGLTGNIAAGKSAVAKLLAELGARVIDADALVHQLEQRGTPTYDAIVAEFGPGILRDDGDIDRARLGARVFSDPSAMARLEAIVHPAVGVELERQISQLTSQTPDSIIVIEAIKLIEAGLHKRCDALWVVAAPYRLQLERLIRTRGLSEAEARTRIEAQSPQSEKIALASVVIDNSGDLEHARVQVLKHYSGIAHTPPTRV